MLYMKVFKTVNLKFSSKQKLFFFYLIPEMIDVQ